MPEVVWPQHPETFTDQGNLKNNNNDSTLYYSHEISKTTVASQTSSPKRTQPQKYVVATAQSPGNQTGNEPVPLVNCSKNRPTDIQKSEQHITTTLTGDTTTPPLTTATPLIEEGLVPNEQTNEIFLPLTSTVALKRKQDMLYLPLDFKINLAVDALVVSGAYVSVIAQNKTIKQKAPHNILSIDDPPNFRIEVANGQLEKQLAATILETEIGESIVAEHFVVMNNIIGPIIGLHFMRNNSVVIDTTHGLITFLQLTMQVKTASSETTVINEPVITDDALMIPPTTTKLITAFVDRLPKRNPTGTVTVLEKFTETAGLLVSHSMLTIIEKRIAARVTNTTESPYLIKKHAQLAEFSVVTPAQRKHIKPLGMAKPQ